MTNLTIGKYNPFQPFKGFQTNPWYAEIITRSSWSMWLTCSSRNPSESKMCSQWVSMQTSMQWEAGNGQAGVGCTHLLIASSRPGEDMNVILHIACCKCGLQVWMKTVHVNEHTQYGPCYRPHLLKLWSGGVATCDVVMTWACANAHMQTRMDVGRK